MNQYSKHGDFTEKNHERITEEKEKEKLFLDYYFSNLLIILQSMKVERYEIKFLKLKITALFDELKLRPMKKTKYTYRVKGINLTT